jgi:aryl-alcohol dehydrogenase-like predicted oxidoreductase
MERRRLGKTGLSVSVLGLGGAEFGYGAVSPATAERVVGGALDAGMNLVDTAECYLASEELLGRALASRRKDVVLTTKCGHDAGLGHADWDRALIGKSINRSLRRLRTRHLDVVFLHSCDEATLRKGEVVEELRKARKAGKVGFLGYSGDGAAARWAVSSGDFDVLQVSVSVADQEAVDGVVPEAARRGMGVLAKRPLANVAWQAGHRPADPYHHAYWERLEALDYSFLSGDICDAVRIALQFTLGVRGVSAALVGTANPARPRQNAELLQQASLPAEIFEAIRHRWRKVAPRSWAGET